MTRLRQFFAGKYVAQEAKRAGQLRADDAAFRGGNGGRFQSAAEVVDTSQRGMADAGKVSGTSRAPKVTHVAPANMPVAECGSDAANPTHKYPLAALCRVAGLPIPVAEFRFHPARRFRFDFAFPGHFVAVEIDGGVWSNGRHTRGAGFIADQQKTNLAAVNGWRVLRYTPDRLTECIADLRLILGAA
jgi:hypothetical protein